MELIATETLYYNYRNFLWVVKGDRLFQVDHDHFVEFKSGNEFHGHQMRKFKKEKPLPYSRGVEILNSLIKNIEELK